MRLNLTIAFLLPPGGLGGTPLSQFKMHEAPDCCLIINRNFLLCNNRIFSLFYDTTESELASRGGGEYNTASGNPALRESEDIPSFDFLRALMTAFWNN